MKFFLDFLPVLVFFVVYKMEDIYAATVAAIVASILQVAVHWFQHRKFEKMHLITLGLMVVLGGATLISQNEDFIKWKPTVINWLFGLVMLGSQFIGKKTIVERMLGEHFILPAVTWIKLNGSWAVFFIAMGCLNLYVAFSFETNTWVNFKLFGIMGLTLLFMTAQLFYISKIASLKVKQDDSN
ncbi:MAG: septation protein A [Gammaproteobacteria bacterium]|nr:septation protein A [Gammaproteobacteria bacterium]